MSDEDPEPVRLGREALSRPMSDFDGWEILMQCEGNCTRQRQLVAELLPRLETGIPTGAMVERLRCQCGARADIVGLSRQSLLGHPPDWLLLRRGRAPGWR